MQSSAAPDAQEGPVHETQETPARNPSLYWLFPLIFIFCFRLGLVIAPRIELYLSLVCAEVGLETHDHVPSSACRASPAAQRKLSSLMLYMLLGIGVFSALSSGFWSSFSDRYGRVRVMAITVFGILVMDAFILFAAHAPPGIISPTAFLAVGGVLEGISGGYAVFSSMTQCYLSDVTPSGSRARLFSFAAGALFAGISVGPLVGGIITGATDNALVTLWFGSAVQALVFIFTLCIPESLSASHMQSARREYKDRVRESPSLARYVHSALAAPARTLQVLLPCRTSDYERVAPDDEHHDDERDNEHDEPFSVSHVPGKSHLDANLFLLSCAYFFETACQAIVPFSLQYTQMMFNWDSEAMSYYMTFTSVLRVIALAGVIPWAIRIIHRPGSTASEPMDAPPAQPVGTSTRAYIDNLWEQRARQLRLIRDSHFDRKLAIFSAVLSCLANVMLGLAHTPGIFLAVMVLVALGSGSASALNSLSLALIPRPKDAGRLFGAWAVLGTVASSLFGPPIYTWVFRATVTYSPSAIFHLAGAMQGVAAVFLLLIRLRHESTLAVPDDST
ncbi:hypothetical protein MCUN1_000116 [Malassezia cuniculi]|uniref:Major facilitator superfamily (MFS) profile domain-containing protein n=1 Tax=Malassezia cuniculi TaxID=948313 RepID=A0AAF0EME9_9BASI|nr:hypothetical protein MCUN1_000116 [Malassezia cuniculi]